MACLLIEMWAEIPLGIGGYTKNNVYGRNINEVVKIIVIGPKLK